MVKTYKCKSTKDLSSWFLFLRVIANIIWVGYAIEVDSMMMLINTVVTVVASIFISYYKVIELNQERLGKKYNIHKNKLLNENEQENEHVNEHGNKHKNENGNEYENEHKNKHQSKTETEPKFYYDNYQKINDNYNYNDNDNDDKLYEV